MSQKKKDLGNDIEMKVRANTNNLEPGHSINEHRDLEAANSFLAEKEIEQQNNNL